MCRFVGWYTSSIDTNLNCRICYAQAAVLCFCIIPWPNQALVHVFTYLCLASTKGPVDGQNSSPEIVCFLSEALL